MDKSSRLHPHRNLRSDQRAGVGFSSAWKLCSRSTVLSKPWILSASTSIRSQGRRPHTGRSSSDKSFPCKMETTACHIQFEQYSSGACCGNTEADIRAIAANGSKVRIVNLRLSRVQAPVWVGNARRLGRDCLPRHAVTTQKTVAWSRFRSTFDTSVRCQTKATFLSGR